MGKVYMGVRCEWEAEKFPAPVLIPVMTPVLFPVMARVMTPVSAGFSGRDARDVFDGFCTDQAYRPGVHRPRDPLNKSAPFEKMPKSGMFSFPHQGTGWSD